MFKQQLYIILIFIGALTSCSNEPINPMIVNYDIVDEDLFALVSRATDPTSEEPIDCIEFNYPFPLFVFDENEEFIEVVTMEDIIQFGAFLRDLPEDRFISLSYPIAGTLFSGDLVEINNNQELLEAIEACVKDQYQGNCNLLLKSCVWDVESGTGIPSEFEGATFQINDNAIAQFHVENEIFFGTWTTFYIGNELHLNIHFLENEAISDAWNFDWKVTITSEYSIELSNNNQLAVLKKECSTDCSTGIFEVCEDETTPGQALFSLNNYTICSYIPSNHDLVSPLKVTFYETEEDALLGVNEISGTAYTNTENPQIVYARIVYLENGEVLVVSEITLEATSCN